MAIQSQLSPPRSDHRNTAAMPRILPFALFMAFIACNSLLHQVTIWVPALAPWATLLPLWLYPIKVAVVLIALIYYWPAYEELKGRAFASRREVVIAVGVGVLVYLAWVRMEWPWATQGQAAGYNPLQAGALAGACLAVIRMVGAAVVVPIMEELFWRSFLLRYITAPQFTTVRLGTFTPWSFMITVVLFGLEHHLWLAGMMAGAAYTALLYMTRRLWPCILAHAVTNFILGVHVFMTGEWRWW